MKCLLNNLSLNDFELQYKITPGRVRGNNFVSAIQLINHEINKRLNIAPGERRKLRAQDYKKAIDEMDNILDVLTRRLKKGMSDG